MAKEEELPLGKDFKIFYKVKIGKGAFGEIFKGQNIQKGNNVAIKCENCKNIHKSLLKNEINILYYLQGGIGIPKIYDYFLSTKHNFMIVEMLGPNLEKIFYLCNKKFSQPTILSLGLQMLNRIEFIHSRQFIHGDIKPENFLIGRNQNKNTVYLCDYGLSKRFRNKSNGMHIPYKDKIKFTGTPSYASIYTHLEIERSRRDDLESLAYILIYFFKGKLPWSKMKTKNKSRKFSKIFDLKMNTRIEDLCSDLPIEMQHFLQYTRDLHFEQKPDYDYLRKLINDMNKNGPNLTNLQFDFINILEKKYKENKNKLLLENKIKNDKNANSNHSHITTKSNTLEKNSINNKNEKDK